MPTAETMLACSGVGLIWPVRLVVAGHGVSLIPVMQGQGEQRAALNLFWEWVGLGASFFMLRQVVRTPIDRRSVIHLMGTTAVTLAAFGIWQHYVELPRVADHYENLRQQWEEQSSRGTSESSREAVRLQRELNDLGVPQNPVSRSLWENRLKSTEPFATFALANTLAGFLMAWLLVSLDGTRFRELCSWKACGTWAGRLAILFCLILTKSRTAWVGLLVGGSVWAVLKRGQSFASLRRGLLWTAGLIALGFVFFAGAALSGGFDRQVISEVPKSLTYRLQYWAGSWQVCAVTLLLARYRAISANITCTINFPNPARKSPTRTMGCSTCGPAAALSLCWDFLRLLVIAARSGWRG